jgi:hypothetical protein
MSRKLKIVRVLKDEDWGPFNALVADRRSAIDPAHQWLLARGYTISRNAVAHYVRSHRRNSLLRLRLGLGEGDDADLREKLRTIAEGLDGAELVTLAVFGAYLVNVKAARMGVKPEPSTALEPMQTTTR